DASTDFTGDDYWRDPDGNQSATASGNNYLELLPDTRVGASDPATSETNWAVPGEGPMVTYNVDFPAAGRYAVAVRAFSTGSEDRGVFVGLNDSWPVDGRLIELCGTQNNWSWSDCDGSHAAWVDVPSEGEHSLVFSAYADGFQFDRISLIKIEPGIARAQPVRTGGRDFLPATGRLELLSLVGLLIIAGLSWRRRES
ncbi:MAG: hypothetical protein KTR33_16090, partial [Gammaproteobacteria bacterium]|nr:hypothetical protein [Gammaproteobacteria bacterium]